MCSTVLFKEECGVRSTGKTRYALKCEKEKLVLHLTVKRDTRYALHCERRTNYCESRIKCCDHVSTVQYCAKRGATGAKRGAVCAPLLREKRVMRSTV
jgi:hypothetical protein